MSATIEERFEDAVIVAAVAATGGPIGDGTVVVGSPDRAGSTTAVVYPLSRRSIVWCAPDLVERLRPLERSEQLSHQEFVDAGSRLGGTYVGAGSHRLLTARPISVPLSTGRLAELDPNDAAHRSLLAAFIAECPEEEVDEAEIDLDDLDPAISVVLDEAGTVISYASAREWEFDPSFDDVGVLTHPAHRGQRLGAAVVSHFSARRQAQGRLISYSHNVENVGSQRVADAVGFRTARTVAAVDFDSGNG